MLTGRDSNRRIVFAADRAALALGIRVGMPASKAQALVTGLVTQDAEPEADRDALDRLALWALRRYSPIVAADPPDGLVIDATGAAHLHGGEQAMLADMLERLARSGIAARASIADSWGAAHALARFADRSMVVTPAGRGAEAMMPLPIEALRLAPDIIGSLRRLGFKHVADLAAVPRAPLTLRFGPEPGRRLDQALGKAPEPIDPIRAPETVEVRRTFAEPIGAAETIARSIAQLAADLCRALEAKGLGARRLDLLCHRVDNRIEAIRVGLTQPVRDPKRIARLLSNKIESLDPGFGIELLRLAATWAEPLDHRQAAASLIEEREADVSDLIDTLANRVGADHLYRLTPVESDIPERSVSRIAPTSPNQGETWSLHWPRPARLLPRPEPIETIALLPDHPPTTFTWRGVRRRVKRADGPERIFGEWWKHDAELTSVRDYFRVEDEAGERFWIFRAGDGEDAATGTQRWFLHGIFG